jgi:hypothetical protein
LLYTGEVIDSDSLGSIYTIGVAKLANDKTAINLFSNIKS